MTLTKLDNANPPDRTLETADAEQLITLTCTELTSRCPISNQPDWAPISIRYRPTRQVVETKSLKLDLETSRARGVFNEHLVTRIRDDLGAALAPATLVVAADFNPRAAIAVRAESNDRADAAAAATLGA